MRSIPADERYHLRIKPRGIFEAGALGDIDPGLSAGRSEVVAAYRSKDGSFGYRNSTDVAAESEFAALLAHARRRIGELADRILAGRHCDFALSARPRQSPCSTCEFRGVCRFETAMNRYHHLTPMNREQTLEILREGIPMRADSRLKSSSRAMDQGPIARHHRSPAKASSFRRLPVRERRRCWPSGACIWCATPKPCCDIDELLVVTFTEDAASQMRTANQRGARGSRMPKNSTERLARQLALVDQAQVSTLHAFCAKLLRQHFHLVGLDPGFRVLDAEEAGLLRTEVATDLFEHYYDTKGDDFFRFVDGYGNGNDRTVIQDMLHLHELLTSVADPAAWMDRSRSQIVDAIELPLEQSELGQELSRIIERGLVAIGERCAQAD